MALMKAADLGDAGRKVNDDIDLAAQIMLLNWTDFPQAREIEAMETM